MVRDAGIPPLSDVRTLLIHVSNTATGTNGTVGAGGSSDDKEERYVVIALTLVCVTVLLSVTIVLVIVIMRRLDRRRKLHGGGAVRHVTGRPGNRGPMHIQNSAFMDPVKMDNFKNDQTDRNGSSGGGFGGNIGGEEGRENEKRMNDSQFGFSPSATGSMSGKNMSGDNGYQVSFLLFSHSAYGFWMWGDGGTGRGENQIKGVGRTSSNASGRKKARETGRQRDRDRDRDRERERERERRQRKETIVGGSIQFHRLSLSNNLVKNHTRDGRIISSKRSSITSN